MYTTRYVIGFILILTASVAVALTGLREVTKNKAAQNEDIFNKRAILSAIEDYLTESKKVSGLSDEEVAQIFAQMQQPVLNMQGEVLDGVQAETVDMAQERKKPEAERRLPLYIYEHNGENFYILSVRGKGLWDEIWGNIALKSDANTIAGAAFDHKGETPWLGAEIKDNPAFAKEFEGTKIYEDGNYVSVKVRKGGAKNRTHEVDAISGATVTSDGVSEMLYRGIKYYQPYLEEIRQSEKAQGLLIQ